jgi:hypothetical protein
MGHKAGLIRLPLERQLTSSRGLSRLVKIKPTPGSRNRQLDVLANLAAENRECGSG